MTEKKDKSKHYVDNDKFFKAMKIWKQKVLDNREVEENDPPTTEYMGECFLKICEHLVMRPNFINYTCLLYTSDAADE